ncbi:hypothetical protein [Streptomyces kanamyceticus]|uniref:Uncharacterized protein n=1 Tax=Streptomyces kanamyceticus TaxID=1967 RepID=A0A5J6GAU5_STRKN|nr:hypothetical protein [Streptomyces kanamyceticus]QEU92599.1 hypothetical protein CP970_18320 [Streptomyces kanamyceticus]
MAVLDDAMTALAAAGGTAVVQAAGTDAWTAVRAAVARWFGRGDAARERAELARLDRTGTALSTAEGEPGRRLRDDERISWRTRFEIALDDLDETVRQELGDELRVLVEELRQTIAKRAPHVTQVSASGPGAQAAGHLVTYGNAVNIDKMYGNLGLDRPSPPDPTEG